MRWTIILGLCMVLLSGCAVQTDDDVVSHDELNSSIDSTVTSERQVAQPGLTFVSAGGGNATDNNVTITMDISVKEK
jgi:hypothetical protein